MKLIQKGENMWKLFKKKEKKIYRCICGVVQFKGTLKEVCQKIKEHGVIKEPMSLVPPTKIEPRS